LPDQFFTVDLALMSKAPPQMDPRVARLRGGAGVYNGGGAGSGLAAVAGASTVKHQRHENGRPHLKRRSGSNDSTDGLGSHGRNRGSGGSTDGSGCGDCGGSTVDSSTQLVAVTVGGVFNGRCGQEEAALVQVNEHLGFLERIACSMVDTSWHG